MKTKKYYAFGEDEPPIHFRPGTSDEHIINNILVNRRDYIFPTMTPKIVYDIGANIGVVSIILARLYPDATIHCFEPVESNFKLLEQNVMSYPNTRVHMFGLGKTAGQTRMWPSDDDTNYGGCSTEIKVDKATFPIRIQTPEQCCQSLGSPDLIKIDVEGAEYDILTGLKSEQLAGVKWIAGELHGIKDFALLDHLNLTHKIMVQRNFEDKVWHFHALSRTWTPPSAQDS